MVKLFRLVISILLIAIVSLSVFAAASPVYIRIGHVGAPISPQQSMGEIFAALVAYKTKGDVQIQLYHSSQLGTEAELQEGVRSGTIDGMIAGTWERHLPWAAVFQTPFLYSDMDHFIKVFSGPLGRELMTTIEKELNVKPLFIAPHGSFRRITNNVRPVKSAADLHGLKLRDPNVPSYSAVSKAVGAVPVPMDFSELYIALDRGVVDGQHNPLSHVVGSKFYEVQKYLTLAPYGIPPHVVTISMRAWNRLSEDQQEKVLEAANDTAIMFPSKGLAEEADLLEFLRNKMEITYAEEIDLDSFLSLFETRVLPYLREAYGEKGAYWIEQIMAY
ncbi:MAG: DctP family TRAP transporter solute-binding subunit [Limnochordia bacterium]|jgi:tripartite ATP-independent transporter DctP family solute receptor